MGQQIAAWMMTVLLVALMLEPSVVAQQNAECSSQFESFDIPLGMHTLLEEGQYVVPWLNFSCSGNITAWEFAAVQDGRMRGGRMRDKQVILQLWEPLPSSINPTSPSQFTLVTSVMLSTRVDGNERTSFSFDLPQPLPFQSGDALGFSILNTGLGIAAVTANGMAERVIYSSQTGGGGRGGGRGGNSKDDDEEEGRSEGSTCEVTCFDISTTVVSPLSAYSPAMTIKFNTAVQKVSTAPAIRQTPVDDGSTLVNQPSVIVSLPPSEQPSVIDDLSPANQPPVADQTEDTLNAIIIGVVLTLTMMVVACVVIVTIVALCTFKRSCVRSMEEDGTVESDKGLAMEGFPYVKFRKAASDKPRHPTVGKYEAVVEHKELSRDGVTKQLKLLGMQSSITSQYAPTYDYMQENEYTSVGYYYVPPAAAREGELQDWCKTATLVDVGSVNKVGAYPKYENSPFTPPPPVLDELYNQLSSGMCLEIPRTTIRKQTLLGHGQFGEVYIGIWESPWDGPQEVAIKMLKEASSEIERVKFLQEAAIMAQFRHPHIVRLLGSVTVDEPSMLILEYLHGGDLRGHLQGCIPYNDISATQLLQFCREIADGMKYLSNKGFVHRDLAARNILLDKNLKCKVADFGLSKDLQEGIYYMSRGGKIPVKWTAPEALLYKKFSTSSDVWSYGMVMYEIWSLGHKPFSHMDQAKVVETFQKDVGYVQPPPPGCPREMFKLMVLCWAYDHHSRPAFSQIVNQLADSDSVMLSIPPRCLEGVSHPEKAQRLGESLKMAHDLYLDLQHYYK